MKKNIRALFVGLNTVDLQFSVLNYPGPNTKTKATKNVVCAGGPATNAAISCGFLGASVDLLTPIGKHSLSKFLLDEISSHQVTVIDPISNIESKPIFASIITSEINGERTIFSYHPGNDHDLLEELKLDKLDQYDIALFDGFYPDLAIPIAKELRSLNITTVLDGGSWKPGIDELLPHMNIAVCSNDFKPPNTKNSNEIVKTLKQAGVEKIAITRGDKSIKVFENNSFTECEIKHIAAADTLGAGDIFHGAFCYYYAQSDNFYKSLTNASNIATESCRYFGTREWMNNYKEVSV